MSEPIDRELFTCSSALVKNGLAFIEHVLAAERPIKAYDNWPVITWSQGMPDFTFFHGQPPVDYTTAFRSPWSFFGIERETEYRFDFKKQRSFQELERYIRAEPHFSSRVFPEPLPEG